MVASSLPDRKADPDGRGDFVRTAVERLMQAIIEAEVEQKIGAGRYERAATRTNSRNGSRPRDFDTTAGTAHLEIPKLRQGSFLPVLLEPRRRADRALVNVVAQAYLQGVSTRRVEDLVRAMGVDGMDKSTVSRLAAVLDEDVRGFRERPTGDRSVQPTAWSDSIARSRGVPMSSASSPTVTRSSASPAPCWPNRMTSGPTGRRYFSVESMALVGARGGARTLDLPACPWEHTAH